MAGKGSFFTPKSKRKSSNQTSQDKHQNKDRSSTPESHDAACSHHKHDDKKKSPHPSKREDSTHTLKSPQPVRSPHRKSAPRGDSLSNPCKRKSSRSMSPRLDMCLSSADDLSDDDCQGAVGGTELSNLSTCRKLSASSEDLRTVGQDRRLETNSAKHKSRTLTLHRKKPEQQSKTEDGKKGNKFWTWHLKKRLPGRLKRGKDHGLPETPPVVDTGTCVCTGYKRTEDHSMGAGVVIAVRAAMRANANASPIQSSSARVRLSMGAGPGPTGINSILQHPEPSILTRVPPPPARDNLSGSALLDVTQNQDFTVEDLESYRDAIRSQRPHEFGVSVSPVSSPYPLLSYPSSSVSMTASQSSSSNASTASSDPSLALSLTSSFHSQCTISPPPLASVLQPPTAFSPPPPVSPTPSSTRSDDIPEVLPKLSGGGGGGAGYIPPTVHTQVDYIHCMVPDLLAITNCSFYWGVMDRYEAERLLENKPEGTFLLRDSAQEEFLFSVSFRRYGRSLHARIEQWNHRFSFDSHDPGVFSSSTVCGLIEHYKDPSCCMFFEPMLTRPLNRTFPFSLQHLCRAVACDHVTYDGINFLPLPKSLKDYLKYYHYKQKVRVRRFEMQM